MTDIALTPKLMGADYRTFWRDRMAGGPAQASHGGADVDTQGAYWASIFTTALATLTPRLVVELGCGWGRMMQTWRRLWPAATLVGIDLSPTAIEGAWRDAQTALTVGDRVDTRGADLALTCTCLQHITDPEALRMATWSLQRCLVRGGTLALLENVSQPRAAHVLDYTAADYMGHFPGIVWSRPEKYAWMEQAHALMIGVKA